MRPARETHPHLFSPKRIAAIARGTLCPDCELSSTPTHETNGTYFCCVDCGAQWSPLGDVDELSGSWMD